MVHSRVVLRVANLVVTMADSMADWSVVNWAALKVVQWVDSMADWSVDMMVDQSAHSKAGLMVVH